MLFSILLAQTFQLKGLCDAAPGIWEPLRRRPTGAGRPYTRSFDYGEVHEQAGRKEYMDGAGKRALKRIPKALRSQDNSEQPGTREFPAVLQRRRALTKLVLGPAGESTVGLDLNHCARTCTPVPGLPDFP